MDELALLVKCPTSGVLKRKALLTTMPEVYETLQRIHVVAQELPEGDACRDKLLKAHQSVSNILTIMKTDLTNLCWLR